MRRKVTGLVVGTLLAALMTATAAFAADSSAAAAENAAGDGQKAVSMEDAVKIALEDAKVTETDAAVYKRIWGYSDNEEIFEIDFLIPGQMKYEYEIAADTGEILENDKEAWEADDDREYSGLTAGKAVDPEKERAALEAAADAAFKHAGVNEADAVISKQGTDYENGREVYVVEFLEEGKTRYEYEISTADGTIVSHEHEAWEKEDDYEYKGLLHPETAPEKAGGETHAITKEAAKDTALKDAGLSENDVTMIRCRLDVDDGVEAYEVEFRTAGGYEYEYEIDAETGKILDKDVELEDD